MKLFTYAPCKSTSSRLCSVILLIACIHNVTGLECEKLNLCSIGKVKSIVTDISDDTGLKTALKARSYKKELVIAVSSLAKRLQFLQLYWNLYHLGYEHILLISYNRPECKKILEKAPYLGVCTWDTIQLKQLNKYELLWHIRYRTLARVIRQGYNSWAVDTDIYFFHDPYTFLKSSTFQRFQVFHQAECVYEQQGCWEENWNPNGGFIYVQNAKPDGPAAWYITEITYRPLRWLDDNLSWMRSQHMLEGCALLDQDTMQDIIPSLYIGSPVFAFCTFMCNLSPDKIQTERRKAALHDAMTSGLKNRTHIDTVTVPTEWQSVVGTNTMKLKYIEMAMPNVAHGSYHTKHAANMYPPVKGQRSESFKSLLAQECPGCPWWPDPEDPAAAVKAAAVAADRTMFLPDWFVLGWYARGRYGYWDTKPPMQVVGHMNYNPHAYGKYHKLIGLMGMGVWNWSVSHEVLGPHVFLMDDTGYHDPQNFPAAPAPPRLVGLSPDLDLSKTRSARDLQELVLGLAQVAQLTGRAVLWPDLPCNKTHWLLEAKDGDRTVPRRVNPQFFPWGGPLGQQSCMWWGYATLECSSNNRGMMMLEFSEFVNMYGKAHNVLPSRDNTVFQPNFPPTWKTGNPLEPVIELPLTDIVAALNKAPYREQPVLYLGHPVRVTVPSELYAKHNEFQHWESNCFVFRADYLNQGRAANHDPLNAQKGRIDPTLKLVAA